MNRHHIWMATAALVGALAMAPTIAVAAEPADRALDRLDTRKALRATTFQTAPAVMDEDLVLAPSARQSLFLAKRVGALAQAAPPPVKEPPTLTFTFVAPLAYSSNPEQAASDADGDGHVDPSIDVTVEIPLSGFLLTLEGTADMDFNFDRPANDSTTLEGIANLDFKQFGAIVPYLNYTVDDIYDRQFGDHVVTAHSFATGFNYSRDFPKVDPNPPAGTPPVTPVTLAFNPELARVETSSQNGDMYRAAARLVFSGAFSQTLGWSLSGSATYKTYTGGTNDGRDDVSLVAGAALSSKLGNGLKLSLAARVQRNESDVDGKSYTVWSVGPTLKKAF
ncbi:MAG: hypothetical protein ABW360_16575 [Phenylobacterium sp.]